MSEHVMTAEELKQQGSCCGKGCKNCPYVPRHTKGATRLAESSELSFDELVAMVLEKKIKQRLDAKCWKGYRKQGTKVKGGVRVNKCVKIKK